MLKVLPLTLLLLFHILNVLSQDLKPKESTIKHDKQKRACWVVHADPEPKTLKKAWNEYLKDNYGFKLKGIGLFANKDLMEAEEVKVSVISNKPVNFFTHIVEDQSGSEMKVFAADQQDYISTSHQPQAFDELSDMMVSFLKSYLPRYHRSRINDTEVRVTQLTEEAADLEEEIEDNMESIEELEEEIQEKKEQMEANRDKLEEARIKLEKRKAKLQRKRSQLQEL